MLIVIYRIQIVFQMECDSDSELFLIFFIWVLNKKLLVTLICQYMFKHSMLIT